MSKIIHNTPRYTLPVLVFQIFCRSIDCTVANLLFLHKKASVTQLQMMEVVYCTAGTVVLRNDIRQEWIIDQYMDLSDNAKRLLQRPMFQILYYYHQKYWNHCHDQKNSLLFQVRL